MLRFISLFVVGGLLAACVSLPAGMSDIDLSPDSKKQANIMPEAVVAEGLREALRLGADRVAKQLGQPGGFLNDAAVKINLPPAYVQARQVLAAAGMSYLLDDLEVRMNQAAEEAQPLFADVFWRQASALTVTDAMQILQGPPDAATRYFEQRMTPELVNTLSPVMERRLERLDGMRLFQQIQQAYASMPFAPPLNLNLPEYAARQAIAGTFYYLAQEEARIRQNPAARTTEILRQVFAQR